jgi:hypothetical protein
MIIILPLVLNPDHSQRTFLDIKRRIYHERRQGTSVCYYGGTRSVFPATYGTPAVVLIDEYYGSATNGGHSTRQVWYGTVWYHTIPHHGMFLILLFISP